jgi:hypothetical protein
MLHTNAAIHHGQEALQQSSILLSLIILLPLLSALILGGITLSNHAKTSGPSEKMLGLFALIGPALATVIAGALFVQQLKQRDLIWTHTLAPWLHTSSFELNFSFSMDHLSGLMTVMITFIGTLIHIFSIAYMHDDRGFSRYFAYLNLFLAAMLLLILSDNIIGNNNAILFNSDYYRVVLALGVLLAIMTVVFNILLIPKYGINGAGFATFISIVIYNIAKVSFVYFKFKLSPFCVNSVKTFVLILVLVGFFYFWDFPFHPVINIGLKSVLLGLCYVTIVLKMNLSDDITLLLNKFLNKKL